MADQQWQLYVRVGMGTASKSPRPIGSCLLLPVLMWVAAALITWLLVSRLLIRPLKHLERSVILYQPGQAGVELPRKLGPSTEIQALRDAFARAIGRAQDRNRR